MQEIQLSWLLSQHYITFFSSFFEVYWPCDTLGHKARTQTHGKDISSSKIIFWYEKRGSVPVLSIRLCRQKPRRAEAKDEVKLTGGNEKKQETQFSHDELRTLTVEPWITKTAPPAGVSLPRSPSISPLMIEIIHPLPPSFYAPCSSGI